MFDDDVDAAPVRDPFDFIGHILSMMVDHDAGAKGPGAVDLLVRSRSRDHVGAVQAGDLNRRLSNPAAGGQHQHGLAPLQLRARDQHAPRREK